MEKLKLFKDSLDTHQLMTFGRKIKAFESLTDDFLVIFLEYLSIEFIGHLWLWKYHEIPNVHSPNGGMSHLLFLVTMRALCIYSSRRSFASISPKEPPSIF